MKFRITIGDWSYDGHEKTENYVFETAASEEHSIKKAYKKALKIVPAHLQPANICTEYEENSISDDLASEIEKYYSIELMRDWDGRDGQVDICTEDMAEMIAAFLTKGGAPTKVVTDDIPYIRLDSFGYGLF
jgi:hypothetical protein